MKELIRKLTEAWGPSGYEHRVRALIREEVEPYADEITVDALGNLICRVGSGDTTIMVAAHMDEIGVMATFVEPKSGYLRFSGIGGLLHTTLFGNRVQFEDGTIGIIGIPEPWGHNRRHTPEVEDFYIDVSDGSGSTAQVGRPAVFYGTMVERGNRITAKALDDRIGCAVAVETMKRLDKSTPNTVYFVFTVQEEVGVRGAGTAAYGIDPDLAIALDVTATGDQPKSVKMAVQLGGGAAIKVHDIGLVVPQKIVDWMVARAEADDIPYQRELLTLGSTDAARIQITRAGVPSGCISIPCRYIHTTSETVDYSDVTACVDLLTGLVSNTVEM